MKKQSQRPTIDVKKEELQKLIGDSLQQLSQTFEQAKENITSELNTQINAIVDNLSNQVDQKLNELKGTTVTVPPGQLRQ